MRLLPILLCAAGLPWTAVAVDSGDFHWRGKLKTGDAIELKGVNGNITAEPGTGSEIEVTARKSGRKDNPESVRVEVVEHGGGVTICSVYPDVDGRRNECKPGEGGHMATRNNDVKVDFTVKVPSGVRLIGRTVNGNIEAHSLKSDVEAYTVNGNVKFSTSGTATAVKTVNGSIDASMGSANWSRPAEFASVNGSVAVQLPANASADVHASTVNGSIRTDFPLTVQGKFVGRHIDGKIGSGGRELKLNTVNGSIQLRQTSGKV